MLDLPHPLFANDIQIHRIRRRPLDRKVMVCPPNVKDHHHLQRNYGPGHFDSVLRKMAWSAIGGLSTAIFEKEINNWNEDNQTNHRAQADETPVKVIGLHRHS